RVPDHPLALELLRTFDGPVAAPSANRSKRISPTTAGHVRDELGDAVDLILDGGRCSVGIESTVLDLSCDDPARPPRILRPGGVSREQIESVIGPVDAPEGPTRADLPSLSPGQMDVHYAPITPAYRFEPSGRGRLDLDTDTGLIALGDVDQPRQGGRFVTLPREPAAFAHHFYAVLR